MKTRLASNRSSNAGFALLLVMIVAACALMIIASTMNRAETVANLNSRNNQYILNQNAAEAAVEMVYAKMAYDFASGGGYGTVVANAANSTYSSTYPTSSQNPYWGNFAFSDGNGHANSTYVQFQYYYTGNLPSPYVVNGTTLATVSAPVYRIISNAVGINGVVKNLTNAVQEDILLAMVPLTTYAIFYNSLMEFSDCATMTNNGRVHANGAIYVGTDATLAFNGAVTSTSAVGSPADDGHAAWATASDNTYFNGGQPTTNVPTVQISMNMSNAYSLIDFPGTNTASSAAGQQLLYYQAQTILLVSNNSVTLQIQAPPSAGEVAGQDTSPTIITISNNPAAVNAEFPWLSTTNTFSDQRDLWKTNLTTQVDVGAYAQWVATNSAIQAKLPGGSSGLYPEILYAADMRTNSGNPAMGVVRLKDGTVTPANGGLGFSVATPNPLYVWGNYNCTNSSYLASTNTSATVPCALMSDALTILSSAWQDNLSWQSVGYSGRNSASAATTINAAILTGIVPTTGTGSTQFSGGVNNLPRMLEDWSSSALWLNTSIINLFSSKKANFPFLYQGTCYNPPTRHFSFDPNFSNPAKQPPGIPCALVPIRFNWAAPPPNTVSFNVTPTYD